LSISKSASVLIISWGDTMAVFGASIQRRLKELEKAKADVPLVIERTAASATRRAVETAVRNTPPISGGLRGTNMRTGAMAQAWVTDSETHPVNGRTVLANNQQYASYVDKGHRMDKHFVPGLIINGGLLERAADGDDGGIMVGVRTTYVKGLYITDKARKEYQTAVREILDREVKKLLS